MASATSTSPTEVQKQQTTKCFTMLENSPEVMNHLASSLGLPPSFTFHEIYSLDSPELLSHIPRPVHALLVIIPLTSSWAKDRAAEEANPATYHVRPSSSETTNNPTDEAVKKPIWFKQTIGNACGSIGLVHCLLNSPSATASFQPDSFLSHLSTTAPSLPDGYARAKLLFDSEAFESAHEEAAQLGASTVPARPTDGIEEPLGQHFVAFVKDPSNRLWELEGGRRGPIFRGQLEEGEDVLSPRAVGFGIGRVMDLARAEGDGDCRFSILALADNS